MEDVKKRVRGRRGQGGFTMIELMMVLAIIAVLSVVYLMGFSDTAADKEKASVINIVTAAKSGLGRYMLDMGRSPASDANNAFSKMWIAPNPVGSWRGPYFSMQTGATVTTSAGLDVSLVRVSLDGVNYQCLKISGETKEIQELLDKNYDRGTASPTAGIVRAGATGTGAAFTDGGDMIIVLDKG